LSLNHDELRDLADSLMFLPDIVESASADDPLLSDAADQAMLATLIAFHADYLVTGDKDLLALADPYSIFAPAAFWALHGRMPTWSTRKYHRSHFNAIRNGPRSSSS
jgi:predicted nucleic acid-binding protein